MRLRELWLLFTQYVAIILELYRHEGQHGGNDANMGFRMKREYDFSKGKRGPILPIPPGKTRITIRIDDEILDWFRDKADEQGGGSYQTMINDALWDYIRRRDESIEEKLRHVVREELARYRTKRRTK
jgi:uncharacterized protein (DUF4415 family)